MGGPWDAVSQERRGGGKAMKKKSIPEAYVESGDVERRIAPLDASSFFNASWLTLSLAAREERESDTPEKKEFINYAHKQK